MPPSQVVPTGPSERTIRLGIAVDCLSAGVWAGIAFLNLTEGSLGGTEFTAVAAAICVLHLFLLGVLVHLQRGDRADVY